MNSTNTALIISNIWLMGAWLVDDFIGWIIMLILSLSWMIVSYIAFQDNIRHLKRKQKLQDLQEQHDFLQRCRDASIMEMNNIKRKNKK